jgi:hypothetical protein
MLFNVVMNETNKKSTGQESGVPETMVYTDDMGTERKQIREEILKGSQSV